MAVNWNGKIYWMKGEDQAMARVKPKADFDEKPFAKPKVKPMVKPDFKAVPDFAGNA